MRILQFVEASAAETSRHVAELTNGLLDRCHEVHLVYSDSRAGQAFYDELRLLGDRPGFRARRILMRWRMDPFDLLAARSLNRYLDTHGPFDLLHCHGIKAGLVGRGGLSGDGLKRIYSPGDFCAGDPVPRTAAQRATAAVEAGLAKLCEGIIVASREEYQHALDIGISPAKLCLIPSGVRVDSTPPPGRTELRKTWGFEQDDFCAGFVGSRVGVEVEIGMQVARAVWFGEEDATLFLPALDALVLSGPTGQRTILQALARALPIIATRSGSAPEMVQHGVNGFVVPDRDAGSITSVLRMLAGDASLRERMALASRAIAQKFSVGRMVDRTLDLYRQVVTGTWDGRAVAGMSASVSR